MELRLVRFRKKRVRGPGGTVLDCFSEFCGNLEAGGDLVISTGFWRRGQYSGGHRPCFAARSMEQGGRNELEIIDLPDTPKNGNER